MSESSEFYSLPADEGEMVWFYGCLARIRASGSMTGGALGVVEFRHPPGFGTPLHVHHREDEAFYVLEGSMRGRCGDREFAAGAGSFVWLPRGIAHGYFVDGDAELRTLAITVPAGFEEFVMEAGEPAREASLPPAGLAAPDRGRVDAAAARYGQEFVGPPLVP